MHIPDGMLSAQVAATGGVASLGAVGYAVRWAKHNLADQKIVLISVMSGLVFALQMLNFPVAPGISGHFAGGTAVAILMGPWPAVIVMATVLLVQALVFADGGILALGLNVMNLAVVGPWAGFALYSLLRVRSGSLGRTRLASFVSAWAGIMATAVAVAFELWLSGRMSLTTAMIGIGGWHALIGIGEGVITASLVAFVTAVRPDVVAPTGARARRNGVAVILLFSLGVGALSWLASSSPDALEWFAASESLPSYEREIASPLAGYAVPSVHDERVGLVLAAIAGISLVAAATGGMLLALRRRSAKMHARELHRHGHVHTGSPEHEHPHHHSEEGHEHAHTSSFERLTYIISPIHSLDARAKILAAGALVLGIVSAPVLRPVELGFIAALLFAISRIAKVPIGPVFRRSLVILPVAIAIALYAPVMEGGWALAYSVVTRAWSSALIVLTLAATTRSSDLVTGLRRLGLPPVFATTLTFLRRFADVIARELMSVRRAVISRAGLVGRAGLVPVYGNVAGGLFIRSYERGERVHAAMLSRGYSGELPLSSTSGFGLGEVSALLVAVTAALAVLYY